MTDTDLDPMLQASAEHTKREASELAEAGCLIGMYDDRDAEPKQNAEWSPDLHPRDDEGQFTESQLASLVAQDEALTQPTTWDAVAEGQTFVTSSERHEITDIGESIVRTRTADGVESFSTGTALESTFEGRVIPASEAESGDYTFEELSSMVGESSASSESVYSEPMSEMFEADNAEYIASEAEKLDMEPEEYRQAIADAMQDTLEDARVDTKMALGPAVKAFTEGEFKNVHAGGEDGASYNEDGLKVRKSFEESYYAGEDRPYYGFLSAQDEQTIGANLSGYGGVTVTFSDAVKERTSFTVGDTLNDNVGAVVDSVDEEGTMRSLPSMVSNPSAESHNWKGGIASSVRSETALGRWENTDDPTDVTSSELGTVNAPYMEAQIFGDLTIDDVERVVIKKKLLGNFAYPSDLTDVLDEKGIEYEVKE